MISIQDCINKELLRRPFYLSLLQRNLLNTSTFARLIQKKISILLHREIEIPSIIACLARAKKKLILIKEVQKIHQINVNFPLSWMSFTFVNANKKEQILNKLININSIYENKNSLVVTVKEDRNNKMIDIEDVTFYNIDSVCELVLEYNNSYHSETGLFYEISREFYWHNISIIDHSNNQNTVWIYIESKNLSKSLEILREKFLINRT